MSLFDGLEQYVKESRPRFEEWLGRLVEIPTVSMDPARRNDMRRGAEVAVGCLTALGAQATIVETGGHPLVVGGWMRDPAWPTVAVYNHLDVQPAMEPEWTREPFKFTVECESYYGRGTTDDKGPALTALLAARYAVEHGVPRNPLAELAAVLAACVDAKTGRVAIPGFYKAVRPLGKADRAQFLKSGFQVKPFAAAHQLTKLRVRDRLEVMKRLWAEPTFEVHGFVGGYTGPGVKTSIPPRAEAKVSMRLVPDQDPAAIFRIFRAYVRKLNPDVHVEAHGMLRPYVADLGGPHAEAVRKALRFGFGKEPAFIREGGSIGAVVTMAERWRAPVMFLGLSLPEHGYHAPNERFDWGQASGGMKAFVAYFDEVSRITGKTKGSRTA